MPSSTATADTAWGVLAVHSNWVKPPPGGLDPKYLPTEEDKAKALELKEYFVKHLETLEPEKLNDYLYNVGVVLKVGKVDCKLAGLVASLIPTSQREQGLEVERRKFSNLKATSKFFGEVGKKVQFRATVVGIKELETQFGVSTMIKFVTGGSLAVWFASGNKSDSFEIGKEYELKGTVKKHEVYKELNQTILTRVSVVK